MSNLKEHEMEHIADPDSSTKTDNETVILLDSDKRNGNYLLSTEKTCFLCREKDIADPFCKVCQNIRSYHLKNKKKHSNGSDEDDDDKVDVSFPGPGVVRRNHIYGNYVVASREIEAGELVILERPLTIGPYGPPDILPICLSCCKDIGLSSKCSICKWPVCGSQCEKFYLHADNECHIFAKYGVKPKGILNEYFSVETLRTLLLQQKNAAAWKRVMEFEPHINARSNDYRAAASTDFITHFIREKCNLADMFSQDVINHVVGILSINTFWTFKDLNRYASCLFDKITLFAHDCDPNTERKLIYLDECSDTEKTESCNKAAGGMLAIGLRVTASRKIFAGEMITIRYIDVNQPFAKRREELKETFYFECTCSRCLNELSEIQNNTQAELKDMTI